MFLHFLLHETSIKYESWITLKFSLLWLVSSTTPWLFLSYKFGFSKGVVYKGSDEYSKKIKERKIDWLSGLLLIWIKYKKLLILYCISFTLKTKINIGNISVVHDSYCFQRLLAPFFVLIWRLLIWQDKELGCSWKSRVQRHQQLIFRDSRNLQWLDSTTDRWDSVIKVKVWAHNLPWKFKS